MSGLALQVGKKTDTRTIFVRNLPYDATDKDLVEFFSNTVPVERAFQALDQNKRPRGFGFVILASDSDVDRIFETYTDGFAEFRGRKLFLDRAAGQGQRGEAQERATRKRDERESRRPERPAQPEIPASAYARMAAPPAPRIPTEEQEQENQDNEDNEDGRRGACRRTTTYDNRRSSQARLIVRNLPSALTPEGLRKVGERFGQVLEVSVPVNAEGRRSRFGFLVFGSHEDAEKMVAGGAIRIMNTSIVPDHCAPKNVYEQLSANAEADRARRLAAAAEAAPEGEDEEDVRADEKEGDDEEEKKGDEEKSASEADFDDDAAPAAPVRRHISRAEKTEADRADELSRTIFIRGVPTTCPEVSPAAPAAELLATISKKLFNVFRVYGSIATVTCVEGAGRRPTGNAFIMFKEAVAADAAIADARHALAEERRARAGAGAGERGDQQQETGFENRTTLTATSSIAAQMLAAEEVEHVVAVAAGGQRSVGRCGAFMNGVRLMVSPAESRQSLSDRAQADAAGSANSLTRRMRETTGAATGGNRNLAQHGLLLKGMAGAEGIPEDDLEVRAAEWRARKKQLSDPNIHVNDRTVCLRNLPADVTPEALSKAAAAAVCARRRRGEGWATINKETTYSALDLQPERMKFGRVNLARSDKGTTRGIAYLECRSFEDAMDVIAELNNSTAFGHEQRPHTEFALDDARKVRAREERIAGQRAAAAGARGEGEDEEREERPRGGFRGRGGFSDRSESRGRGSFRGRGDSRGRGNFHDRSESRGRDSFRGRGESRGRDGFRGRGDSRGRGNFRPRD